MKGMEGESFLDYMNKVTSAAERVSVESVYKVISVLRSARDKNILIVGNGGSAAIASHFVTDLYKAFDLLESDNKVFSLADNTPLLSATGNDFGFEHIFARQVSRLGREGDILIAISSSGKSANILNAVRSATNRGLLTIGLSGFDGGDLRYMVDISVHVPTNVGEYQTVEDIHSSICHYVSKAAGSNTWELKT